MLVNVQNQELVFYNDMDGLIHYLLNKHQLTFGASTAVYVSEAGTTNPSVYNLNDE